MNNPDIKMKPVTLNQFNFNLGLLFPVEFLEKYMSSLAERVVNSVVSAKEPMCRDICTLDKAKPLCFTSLLSLRKASTRITNKIVLMTMSRLAQNSMRV